MNEPKEEGMSNTSAIMLSFVAGAALGALVVALTTPKSGPEVREDLKALGRKAKTKVGEMGEMVGEAWSETKGRTGQAMADLKRGMHEAAGDLRG
jgi:gas vesicle protein